MFIRAGSRLVLLAPHPDDETLAAGGLLQCALAAGAAVSVVFVTDGEDNPWPQRFIERRWRVRELDRARWGARRRREALRALEVLGVAPHQVRFLGLPDQRITSALLSGGRALSVALRRALGRHEATHVAYPSPHDHHPDHSALGVAVRAMRASQPGLGAGGQSFEYLVHDGRQRPAGRLLSLELTRPQIERKRMAIQCHHSQLLFRRRELLGFARPLEFFFEPGPEGAEEVDHPIRTVALERGWLVLTLRRKRCLRAFGATTACLVFPGMRDGTVALQIPLPGRFGRTPILDPNRRGPVGYASYGRRGARGELALPVRALPRGVPGFIKLVLRHGFFDEAGWRSLPLIRAHTPDLVPLPASEQARRLVTVG